MTNNIFSKCIKNFWDYKEEEFKKRRKEKNKCNCNKKRRSFSIPDSWIM